MGVFQWPVRVFIEDTDAGGIVYYVNYLKFMERARTEYLRSLGFGKSFIFNNSLMFVVHSVAVNYQKPAQLDDQLMATARIVDCGAANIVFEQLIYRLPTDEKNTDKELLCSGEVKIVCVDQQTMKPKRIPKDILSAVASH